MDATDEPVGAELLASPVRRRIVDLLHAYGRGDPGEPSGLTASQLADMLDMHVTSVRFHLDQLVTAGIVTTWVARSGAAGRPHKRYAVAPGSLDLGEHPEGAFRVLAELLTRTFTRHTETGESLTPEQAGQEWARTHVHNGGGSPAATSGQWLSKIGQMVDVLRDFGYTPEVSTSRDGRTAEITIVDCPFLELARTHPAVVCGIHRGLITGTLQQLGETGAQSSLEPFVHPNVCRARVSTSTPFEARGPQAPNPSRQESTSS
ncbi:MAG: helix-turn-helix domain-containing protein [Tetrasphaera sp.]